MFVQPTLYLLVLLFAVVVYWSTPQRCWRFRATFLTVVSIVLVTLMVPALGVALLASSALAHGYKYVRSVTAARWPAALFVCVQIALMILPDLTDLSALHQLFALAGMSYFTLRNIGYVIDVYKRKCDVGLLDLLFLNSFYPTYSAGPVENIKTFNAESCNTSFSAEEFVFGLCRILIGILKFYWLADQIVDPFIAGHFPRTENAIAEAGSGQIVAMALVLWLSLYLSFSGYADLAIGSSKLFSLKIRENFRYPFLAVNIQDFWRRWNISIMNFVSEFVYLNFVRTTGLRITGLFLVFLVIGMWHHVSWTYLFWAVAHGSAMALTVMARRAPRYQQFQTWIAARRYVAWPLTVVSWVLTLTFVSVVSAVANSPGLSAGVSFLQGVF